MKKKYFSIIILTLVYLIIFSISCHLDFYDVINDQGDDHTSHSPTPDNPFGKIEGLKD